MCAGVESAEVSVQSGLAGPVAGRIGDHQWGIESDDARTADVGLKLGQNVVVVAGYSHMAERTVAVEYGHTRRAALAPCEVDSHEVHTPNRKL